jgi:hypothetical protein
LEVRLGQKRKYGETGDQGVEAEEDVMGNNQKLERRE